MSHLTNKNWIRLGLLVVVWLAWSATAQAQSWWNNNYQYRKQITVTTGSASAPSGYSVQVQFNHATLVTAGKSLSSGDDVRVLYWNGSTWTELDRSLDAGSSWNNAATQIWFKTQALINSSSSDNNYYLYYGYSSATSPPANKSNVFLFADDFEAGNLNNWTQMPSGSWTADNTRSHAGTYSLKYPAQSAAERFLVANPSLNVADVYLDSWWYVNSSSTSFDISQIIRQSGNQTNDSAYFTDLLANGSFGWDISKEINLTWSEVVAPAGSPSANTWIRVGSAASGTTLRNFINGTQISSATSQTNLTSGNVGFSKYAVPTGASWWVDDVIARRYANPEPTSALGSETAPPKTWTGGAGTNNWGDANNWSPVGVPTSSNDVSLTGANTININVAAVANNLTLNNASLTLTINSGQSLTLSANLTLTSGTLNTQAAFPTVTGTVDVSGGTVGFTGSSAQTVPSKNYNNLTIANTSAVCTLGTSTTVTGALVINSSAQLSVSSGVTLTIASSGTATVNGTLTNAGTVTATGPLTVNGTYQHNENGGSIPAGNYASGSLLRIIGITSTIVTLPTTNLNGSVEWNSPSQTVAGAIFLAVAGGATQTIGGDFNLVSTGTGSIIGGGTSARNLSVGGNMTVSGGTYNAVGGNGGAAAAGNVSVTVAGNLTVNGGTFRMVNADGGSGDVKSGTLSVSGNLTVSSGNLTILTGLESSSSPASSMTINGSTSLNGGTLNLTDATGGPSNAVTATLKGNVSVAGATLSRGGSLTATVNFGGTTAQTYTKSSGTISGTVNFAILSGATVNFGTSLLDGSSGTFNLNSGGSIGIGNTSGITSSGSSGNIQVSGTRTYSTGANYTYNGSAAQVTGNGLPATVNTLTINNSTGVSLTSSVAVTSTLTLSNGALSIGANTLTINADISIGSGSLTGGSSSNITFGGSGASTTLPAVTLNNLTMNRANGISLGGNVTVGGTLTFTSGNITPGSNTLYINSTGTVSRTSGYVVGNFKKFVATGATSKTFEIGDASNYTPVTVSFASVNTAGDLTVSTTAGSEPNLSSSGINSSKDANRYWTLTNSGIVFTTYSVTLNFVSGDVIGGANTSNFIVGLYSSGWTYPTVGTKTSTSTQATGVSGFGDFQAGESGTTATWTGAVNNLWSNGGNWSGLGGAAPTAGNDLIFASGSSNLSTSNDLTAGTSFNSITISGNGYTLAGNSIVLAAGNLSDTNSSGANTISLAISMSATRTFSVSNAGETLTVSGVLSGAGGLIKNGGGNLTLSGANSYSGATTTNAGTLKISADNNLGTAPGSATAGQLTFGGGTLATTATFTLSANRGIAFNSTGTIDVASSTTLTYGGIAAGSGGLTKTGAGTLTLSGANTYSGATTINVGTLSISADNNLGTAPGSATAGQLTFGGGTLATTSSFTMSSNRGVAFTSTGTIDVASSTTLTYGGIAAGSGGLTKTGAGTLTLSGANTYSGATTINVGTLSISADNNLGTAPGSATAGQLTFGGGTLATTSSFTMSSNRGVAFTSTGTIDVASSTTLTYGGIAGGSGGLTKTSAGTLTLSGANTYTGATTISAGTLKLGANNSVPNGSAVTVTSTFDLAGFNDTIGSLAGGGTVTDSSATTSALTTGGDNTSTTFSGVIQNGSGKITLTKFGTGTFTLSGANTYTGATTINAGTIQINDDSNLGTAPGSATAGQLTFGGGTLATTATFTLNSNRGISFSSTGTMDVAASTTLTHGGIAAGTGGLTKIDSGTLTLSGNNTYNGTTTVSAGLLLVNGSQSSSAVSLSGGTIGGTGTVGAVGSTSSGGTVSPGSGPGILNSGNVNWSSGSPSFVVELNGTTAGSGYDQLNVTGTINLTGATLSGTSGFTPARGTTFTIIKNNTGGAITGTFAGLAEGAGVSLGSTSFTISYVGGSGHDVVVTASGPNVTLANSVNPSGTQPPGTDLAYTVTFTNTQCCSAQSLVITDPIPANTDFKVGSATTNLGTTGLTVAITYSNDSGSTYTYTPVTGGGGASSGYDRNVTNTKWTFTGNLSQTAPNNIGSLSFTSRIR